MRPLSVRVRTAVVGSCLALSSFASACDSPSEAQRAPVVAPVRVQVAPVERRELAEPVHATGVLVDTAARTLSFAVGGVIADIRVDDGDTVRRGQVLARLELDTVNAQVAQTSAALERAERELTRAETLARTGSIPRQTLDDAHTAIDLTRADARAASFARRHAVVVAPADGVVLSRSADPGETVGVGTPILTVALANEERIVRVSVTDREIVRLREGDAASVTLDAYPGRILAGTVSRVAASADPATGLHAVEIACPELASLGGRATAGLVARATLTPNDAAALSLVPPRALVEADEQHAEVWALATDGRRAVRKRVEIAFLTDDRVAIRAGLEGVDRVVTEGAAYVRDGSVLDVRGAP